MDQSGSHGVERILKKRTKNRRVEYLVKWKNFDEQRNSWVCEKDLNCDDLLVRFKAENSTKKRPIKMKTSQPTKKLKSRDKDESNKENVPVNSANSNGLQLNRIDIANFTVDQGIFNVFIFLV